jgi:hypothetical protein
MARIVEVEVIDRGSTETKRDQQLANPNVSCVEESEILLKPVVKEKTKAMITNKNMELATPIRQNLTVKFVAN